MTERGQNRHLDGPLIVLDAGHGGGDLGSHTKFLKEKSATLLMTLMTKRYLNDKGYRVIMTRSRDVFVPLKERAAIANRLDTKAFVSIHFNAHRNTTAHGIEVYYYPSKKQDRLKSSRQMAQSVLQRLLSNTGAVSRGVKKGNFCVIRETNMPAILIEGGFITNPSEGKKIATNQYLDTLARAAAEGIDRYFKHQ